MCPKLRLILLIFTWLSIIFVLIDSKKECVGRKGKNTIYCVCTKTHCDELDPLSRQAKGVVIKYQTSKSGDRFKESKLMFSHTTNSSDGHIVVTIDKSKRHQKMFGIGAAFTDSAVINIDSLPKPMAEHLIRDYFSTKGIELSVARIPIAGSDFSIRDYTYDDDTKEDFELKHWKLAEEDTKHKIPNIKLAQSVSANKLKLFGTPWATPRWLNNKTALKTQGDKYYQTWANYLIRFLDSYKQNGVDIWGLTIQNEPLSFSSMNFQDSKVERDFVSKHLGPALVKAGYTKDKFNLMVYDDGSQYNPIIPYVDTILNETDANKYINGIAYHCYYVGNYSWIADFRDKYPDKFIMMTECCQNFRHGSNPLTKSTIGDWDQLKGYIISLMNSLQNNVVGWSERNLALDTYGHPNKDVKVGDAPLIINVQKMEYYKNPNFYGLGHFSKFIAPDSVRVEVTSNKDIKNFNFVVFERPDNSTTVIVYNLGDKPIDFIIKDPNEGQVVTTIGSQTIQSYIYWQ